MERQRNSSSVSFGDNESAASDFDQKSDPLLPNHSTLATEEERTNVCAPSRDAFRQYGTSSLASFAGHQNKFDTSIGCIQTMENSGSTRRINLLQKRDDSSNSDATAKNIIAEKPTTPQRMRKSFLFAANTGKQSMSNAMSRRERRSSKSKRPSCDDIPIFFESMTTSYADEPNETTPTRMQHSRSDSEDTLSLKSANDDAFDAAQLDNAILQNTVGSEQIAPTRDKSKRRSLRFSLRGGKNLLNDNIATAAVPSKTIITNKPVESSPRALKKFLFGLGKQQHQRWVQQSVQPPPPPVHQDYQDIYESPQQQIRPRVRANPTLPTIEASPTVAADLESLTAAQTSFYNRAFDNDAAKTFEIVLDGQTSPHYRTNNDSDVHEDGDKDHWAQSEGNEDEQSEGSKDLTSVDDEAHDGKSGQSTGKCSQTSPLVLRETPQSIDGTDERYDKGLNAGCALIRPYHTERQQGDISAQPHERHMATFEQVVKQNKQTVNVVSAAVDDDLPEESIYESVYLQELKGQARASTIDFNMQQQLLADEELARRLQEELEIELSHQTNNTDDVADIRVNSCGTETDAEIAARVATMLMRDELGGRRDAITSANAMNQSSVEEQRYILEEIRRKQQNQPLVNEDALTSPSRVHLHNQVPSNCSHSALHDHSGHTSYTAHTRILSPETLEQTQRRKEAFERQFYDRSTGSVEVTIAEREHVKRAESIGSRTYHPGVESRYANHFNRSQPNSAYLQTNTIRPMSADPDDWEFSQRQELLELERQRMLRLQQMGRAQLSPSVMEMQERNHYLWQENHLVSSLPLTSPSSHDLWAQSDLLRRGQVMTQRAVLSGRSHIILCQGCGNRLQAPVHSSLVYCPSCGVVSPGQAVQQPLTVTSSHAGPAYGNPRYPRGGGWTNTDY
ncbi:hypothetical protein MPSEU_000728700 [Mayamaea pseudoterrestris]|nr:hypothetical protein MPSEU_000728700 [Mayamaea pseudoterrestris]